MALPSVYARDRAIEGTERNLHGYYGYGYPYSYPRYFGYGYRPYSVCYYSYYYGGGYVCYLLSATTSAFTRIMSEDAGSAAAPAAPNDQRMMIYERAEADALRYLDDGGEPTPELRAALDLERRIVRESGLPGGNEVTDRTLAELVLARLEQMKG
jgi:hypothetical protein